MMTSHEQTEAPRTVPLDTGQWMHGLGQQMHLSDHYVPAGSSVIPGTRAQYQAICGARCIDIPKRPASENYTPMEMPKHERCEYLLKHRSTTD